MTARRAVALGLLALVGACGDDAAEPTAAVACDRSPIHEVRVDLPTDFEDRAVAGFGGGADAPGACAVHYVSRDRAGRYVEVVQGQPSERLTTRRTAGTYQWGPVHEGFMAIPSTPEGVFVRAYGVGEAEFEAMLTR